MRDFGFKVVMTGEGSDEILAGYPFFRRDMLTARRRHRRQDHRRAPRGSARGATRSTAGSEAAPAPALPLESVASTLGFVPWIIGNFAERGNRMQPLLSGEFVAEFPGRDPYRVLLNRLDVAGQMQGRAAVHQAMYLWAKTMFPNKLLNFLGDRMEMAHSIEGRTPFLDHHLVEARGGDAGRR